MNTDDYLIQLRQKDRFIRRCLFVCKQSVLYKLKTRPSESNPSGTWEKTGVDGMLFLVEREYYPYYVLTVFNRISLDEFSKALTETTKVEIIQNFVYVHQSAILRVRANATEEDRLGFRPDADGGENEVIAFWIPPSASSLNNAPHLLARLKTVISYLEIYKDMLTGRLPMIAAIVDDSHLSSGSDETKSSSGDSGSSKAGPKFEATPSKSGATSGSRASLANLLSGKTSLSDDPQAVAEEFLETIKPSSGPETEGKTTAAAAAVAAESPSQPEATPGAGKKQRNKASRIPRENFAAHLMEIVNNEARLNKLYENYTKNPKLFDV